MTRPVDDAAAAEVPQWSRRRCCAALAASAAGTLAACAGHRIQVPKELASPRVPAFSAAAAATELPAGWAPHIMRRDRPPTQYRLHERDERVVVHAVAEHSTSGLRCDVDIDPHATPWLGWEWRVDRFPRGASVADDERDDSPARVVLAFDGDMRQLRLRDLMFMEQVELFTGKTLPFATLMYTWDGEAAVDSVIAYPRSSRIQYLVVEQGPARAGRWLRYRRNVVDDYRRVFGADPGPIRHVGVLTDSDDLRLRVESWFGDITLTAI
ncbi:DUF3047 domain-containing protein [Variovorax sp. YR752]|uniref:DUF3047 domain-containing protein n=1 Tax=Variovorax sp. YR752 TaxID=1884383 RepID=UPI003137BBD7